jgi:hypothetical protein
MGHPGVRFTKPDSLYRHIERLSKQTPPLTVAQIALRVGVSRAFVYAARFHLRNTGAQLQQANTGRPVGSCNDDGEDDLSGARCGRCGLRLPCNDCLPTSAAAFATNRRYDGNQAIGTGGQKVRP